MLVLLFFVLFTSDNVEEVNRSAAFAASPRGQMISMSAEKVDGLFVVLIESDTGGLHDNVLTGRRDRRPSTGPTDTTTGETARTQRQLPDGSGTRVDRDRSPALSGSARSTAPVRGPPLDPGHRAPARPALQSDGRHSPRTSSSPQTTPTHDPSERGAGAAAARGGTA